MHPYKKLDTHAFWKKVILGRPVGLVDPMMGMPSFKISKNDKVATMGSCFAQHVSALIKDLDLNFFVADSKSGTKQEGFGVFSGRYGNVYTVRQALALLKFMESPGEQHYENWEKNGVYFDSMRPNAIPGGFKSIADLEDDRDQLTQTLRNLLTEMDVLVYTLGLTEGWVSNKTGQIFPIAPGVVAGEYRAEEHIGFNDGYQEVKGQFIEFLDLVREINPNCKFIVTVSPVPLAATHSNQNVLVANQYSKSVLRVVAQEIALEYRETYYFPSYEIITSLAQPGKYFQPNLRDIYPRGVGHAMRIFKKHFIDATSSGIDDSKQSNNSTNRGFRDVNGKIQCDEEIIYNMESD